MAEHFKGFPIRPVNIVYDEHERSSGAQRSDDLRNGTRQAVSTGLRVEHADSNVVTLGRSRRQQPGQVGSSLNGEPRQHLMVVALNDLKQVNQGLIGPASDRFAATDDPQNATVTPMPGCFEQQSSLASTLFTGEVDKRRPIAAQSNGGVDLVELLFPTDELEPRALPQPLLDVWGLDR